MAASHRHQQKRHGKHQKHTRPFLKVYTPYLPVLVITIIGLVLSVLSPPKLSKNVLSYATTMSRDQLLQSTNHDRVSRGLPALRLNSKLNSAAQAKANDMVARDYWSHKTPDGKQPWVFISNAGYTYRAAGENLAYGFATGGDTIDGWMNSPGHKANMLNKAYVDVGFGYKNSKDYVNSGQETVVVAEYAAPTATKAATTVAAASTTTPAASSSPDAVAADKKTSTKSPEAVTTNTNSSTGTDVKTTDAAVEPITQSISRVSSVTNSNLAWLATAATVITIVGLAVLAARHAYALRKWLKHGQRYVMHHLAFDLTVLSLIGLLYIATQTVGFIK